MIALDYRLRNIQSLEMRETLAADLDFRPDKTSPASDEPGFEFPVGFDRPLPR
jgi:hypothetical protein